MSRKPKIGLALGAGAMRGIAHIGVLEVFEEAGIPVDMIAGCSMGAIVGGLYAAGVPVTRLKEYTALHARNRGRSLIDFTFPKWGLMQGNKISNFLTDVLGEKTFEDTLVPFSATVCCLEAGEVEYIREGRLAEVLRASIAIPGVFEPVRRDGKTYVDGGVLDRVPSEALRRMGADVIIGVDVGYRGGSNRPCKNIYDVLMTWNSMVEWRNLQWQPHGCDLILTPDVAGFDPANMGPGLEIYQAGRAEAIRSLGEVGKLLSDHERTPLVGKGGLAAFSDNMGEC